MIFNKRFGRYTLVKKLATGGMGDVYLALKRGPDHFEKLLALKQLHSHLSGDQAHKEMFYQEARIGALFEHPNLVHVFDADRIEGRPTMVMEFVAGRTVEEIYQRCERVKTPLAIPIAMAVASQAAVGLYHAHSQKGLDGAALGIVHRDVSPQNILVGFDGEVKVFDFGVAVAARAGSDGQLAGKTAYMSPEQCRGKSIDRRSDIFSLGIVLYELLTGQRLFKRENHIKSIRAITEDEVPPPSTLRGDVPEEVDAIVMRALARSAGDRYDSALEFHVALADYLAHHDVVVESEAISSVMHDLFANEIDEIDAVVQKVLLAPEQSEATIDLATFDLRDGDQNGAKVGIDHEGDLGPLAIHEGVGIGGGGPLAATASAAMVDQLRRARRWNIALVVLVLLAILGAGAALFLPDRSTVALPTPAPDASAPPETIETAVTVASEPAGAAIGIGGEPTGHTTPAQIDLPAGVATEITISLPGYRSVTETVIPDPGNPTSLAVSGMLEIDAESEFAPIGSIRVVYDPPDADVFLDGELAGAVTPVVVEGLTLNTEYQLRLERNGYETLHFPVMLDSADIREIQLDMAEALELGTLNIDSRPGGADVHINGESLGETPIEGLELPANQTYTVEVRRSGYRRWRRAILLRPDAVEEIEASLESLDGDDSEPRADTDDRPRDDRREDASTASRPEDSEDPEDAEDPEVSGEPDNRYQLLE